MRAHRLSSSARMLTSLLALAGCGLGIQVGNVTSGGATSGQEVSLGTQTGATTVNASDSNPCEAGLDFGNVPVGLSESAVVNVENTGTEPLVLAANGTLGTGFSLLYDTHQPIPAGGSGQFTVTFQPLETGTVAGALTIPTNDANPSCPAAAGATDSFLTVNLTGTGITLSLVVQPSVLDFGDILINTTGKMSVTLINKSTAPLTSITATVVGSDANIFQVDNAPPTLAAGASATVDISYAPLALETRSIASVVFTGSDGEKATLNLYGEPVGVALTVGPNPINFGYVPTEPIPAAVGCTVFTNQSNVAISITGISEFENEGGAFALATTDDATPPNPFSLPITIQGGATAKVCFSFFPPISQDYNGQVTLLTTDPSGTNPVISLTGWGGGPQIKCTQTSVAFGPIADGKTSMVPVLCSNSGTAVPGVNLLFEPPTTSPTVFSAWFDEKADPDPQSGLAPGQTAQIDVSYAPTGISNDKGTLFIKSNGGQGATIQIPLTGQGTD